MHSPSLIDAVSEGNFPLALYRHLGMSASNFHNIEDLVACLEDRFTWHRNIDSIRLPAKAETRPSMPAAYPFHCPQIFIYFWKHPCGISFSYSLHAKQPSVDPLRTPRTLNALITSHALPQFSDPSLLRLRVPNLCVSKAQIHSLRAHYIPSLRHRPPERRTPLCTSQVACPT